MRFRTNRLFSLARKNVTVIVLSKMKTKKMTQYHSLASVAMVLTLLLLQSGCATSRLPERLSPSERAFLNDARQFPVVIAVQQYKYPVYSKKLIRDLRSTGLFEEVKQADDLDGIDFLARVEGPVYGTAVIPLLTFLSLGIIPTTVQEEHGNDFSIEPLFTMADKMRIPYRYSTESILGWKALFLNVLPNWSLAHDKTSRYRNRFAVSLLKNKALMEMLKKKTKPSTEGDGLKPAP